MAASKKNSVRPWTPMIAFFGLIVGIVVLLWWMSRPDKPTSSASSSPSAAMTAPGPASSMELPPGARVSRKLCGPDQVRAYIGKEVTEGELPEADLRELTKVVMGELEQMGAVKNGCVESEIVKALIYQMANEANQAPM